VISNIILNLKKLFLRRFWFPKKSSSLFFGFRSNNRANRQHGCNSNDSASNAKDSCNKAVERNDRRNGNSIKHSIDVRRLVATYDNRAIVPVATYRTYGRPLSRNVIRRFWRRSAEYYVANVDVDETDLPILVRNKPDRPNCNIDEPTSIREDNIDRNRPDDVSRCSDIIPIELRPYAKRSSFVWRLNWPCRTNRVRIDRRLSTKAYSANTYPLGRDSIWIVRSSPMSDNDEFDRMVPFFLFFFFV